MAIIRLQHFGIAVSDYRSACARFEHIFGLIPRDYRNDQGRGYQWDSRVLLGNGCWLHIVHNWNPESRVYQFNQRYGGQLEHIALETDDIEADVQRLRDFGVPIYQDKIFNANDGYEAFVYPDDAIGFTVELIQPHQSSWGYPDDARNQPVSTKLGITHLQHIGVAVADLYAACERFEQLFGLSARDFRNDQAQGYQLDARIPLGNQCWLHLVQNWNPASRVYQFHEKYGQILEHIALSTTTIEADVAYLNKIRVPLFRDKIIDANDGYEAFVYPEDGIGFTVELIQPHATSWTYP
jgi:4-hydroxyphenylpyruvate dioxygenase-like putative hemolysin